MAPAYLSLKERGAEEIEVKLKLPLISGRSPGLKVLFPEHCRALGARHQGVLKEALISHWRLRCSEGGLSGALLRFEGIRGGLRELIVNYERPKGVWAGAVFAEEPELRLPQAEASPTPFAYLRLGVIHILEGFDHLLFVLGLLLLVHRRGLRRSIQGEPPRQLSLLLRTVTAFTLAHSLTLGIASLGYMRLSSAPVELSIALSILLLAVELSRKWEAPESLSLRYPALLAFLFGLLHGFGFAGALSEIGFPEGALAIALLLFNLGVELGQLLFIALLALAWMLSGRYLSKLRPQLEGLAITLMGAAATFWCLERALGLFS